MASRLRTRLPVWLGAVAGVAVCLVLVDGGSDTAAHEGHDTDMWEFTWNRGTTERLLRYRFWHYNSYKQQRCAKHDQYTGKCGGWVDTGATRTRPEDSCAAKPEWVVAELDASNNQQQPDPPTGASCNRHNTYTDGDYRWVFWSHVTKSIEVDATTGPLRCRLPITNIQSPATSTDTNPPGGESPVYRSSQTQPSRGSPPRCGWWSGARLHSPDTVATTAPPMTTPSSTAPDGGSWSGGCSFSFAEGRSYSRELPTHSGTQVTSYSYSGGRPHGMSMTLAPPRIAGTPTGAGTFSGTLTARMSGGAPSATLTCTFLVTGTTEATTTTTTRPVRAPGWTGACYVTMRLGESLGDRRNPEVPLPWYNGADTTTHSGRLPQGVKRVRIEGEQFFYGQALEIGTFNGQVTAWRGRTSLSTQDCVIVVTGGTWNPPVCEFYLETGATYDLSMPRYTGVPVDRYYISGALPPGLSTSPSGVVGSPTSEGSWSVAWKAVIDGVSTRPSITCTFSVTAPDLSGWSGTCDWTFTVGYSYTRALPVASGATGHLWTGDVPVGMSMRYVNSGGVWVQQLSGTPTTEGMWGGTIAPHNPRPEGLSDLGCSFEVVPGPDTAACSLTIPAAEVDRIRDEVEWRSDLPKANAHAGVPGGDNYLFTTGDPGVGGGSPRIWPWWSSDSALAVVDTTGCVWRMVEVLSAAHPLFPWYGSDLDVIRQASPAMHAQWQAMTPAQRAEAEASGRRVLLGVGLGTPEDGKWLGSSCRPDDDPGTDCVWGLPFPGVWNWSLAIRYRSIDDYRDRDLTISSGANRFWRFSDHVGG